MKLGMMHNTKLVSTKEMHSENGHKNWLFPAASILYSISASYKYHCLEIYHLFWTSLAATAFSTLAQLIAINAS